MMGLVFTIWLAVFAAILLRRRRWAMLTFAVALVASVLMFLHHATDSLGLNL